MRTERLDINVYRNADYQESWQINDDEGQPIDLTGCAVDMRIRAVAGQGLALATPSVTIADATHGVITILILGSSLASVPGQSEIVRLAYDLRLTYPDGVKAIPVEGQINLIPGATY